MTTAARQRPPEAATDSPPVSATTLALGCEAGLPDSPDGADDLTVRVLAAREVVEALRRSRGASKLDGTPWDRQAVVDAEAELGELEAALAEQHRRDRAKDAKAEAARQAKRLKKIARLHAEYRGAMGEAEAAGRALGSALERSRDLGKALAAAMVEASFAPPQETNGPAWARRVSWHLSASLRGVATGPRFGNVTLHAAWIQPETSWQDEVLAETINRITGGSHAE